MFRLFLAGGIGLMSVLTILLIAIIIAAWKAPRWVKEIGSIACALGFFSLLLGLRQMFEALQAVGDQREAVTCVFDLISPNVLFGGLKVALIPVLYGIIIYIVSRIVVLIRKPRFYA